MAAPPSKIAKSENTFVAAMYNTMLALLTYNIPVQSQTTLALPALAHMHPRVLYRVHRLSSRKEDSGKVPLSSNGLDLINTCIKEEDPQ